MRSIPWTTPATYRDREQNLSECLTAWHRDASRGVGALGTIHLAQAMRLDSWKSSKTELGIAECLELLAIMPTLRATSAVAEHVALNPRVA